MTPLSPFPPYDHSTPTPGLFFMDPLSAVGLAGNILQLVGTTTKLLSAARQISKTGVAEHVLQLESLTKDVRDWAQRVTPLEPQGPKHEFWTEEEESIRGLGRQSREVADELLGALDKLKAKHQNQALRPIESIYRAWRAKWSQSDIEALESRLEKITNGIQRQLATYDSSKILKRLDAIDDHRRGDVTVLASRLDDMFKKLSSDSGLRRYSIDETAAFLQKAAAQGSRYAAKQLIMKQLRFDAMDDRRGMIAMAHSQTFTWIFGTSGQAGPTSFNDWLTSNKALYWISGKPGSGKSTLMKYLLDHHQTNQHLKDWAAGSKPLCASHFFWTAGGEMLQKSQEGLLRSLLCQILDRRPDLIPRAYPGAWQLYSLGETDALSNSWPLDPTAKIDLSNKGLMSTLVKLCEELAKSGSKICFFIDGLDEHTGRPDDMIALVRKLKMLPNTKLCISSRPWNEFEQEFGRDSDGCYKLYMQHFNEGDIRKYVSDTFAGDQNYQDHEEKDFLGRYLTEEIVQASNGIFLWVFLVVRSCQEGLMNGDSIARLRTRLKELPQDLNEYFERIVFQNVPESYRSVSANMFRVALAQQNELPLFVYWFVGEQRGAGDGDGYHDHQEMSAGVETLKPLAPDKLKRRLENGLKRLNVCCKGLLEIQAQRLLNLPLATTTTTDTPPGRGIFTCDVLHTLRVGFLHRTAYDFLSSDDTQAVLAKWRPLPSPASVLEMLCEGLLEQIRSIPADPKFWADDDLGWFLCYLFDHYLSMGRGALAGWSAPAPEPGSLGRQPPLPPEVAASLSNLDRLQKTLEGVLTFAGAKFTLLNSNITWVRPSSGSDSDSDSTSSETACGTEAAPSERAPASRLGTRGSVSQVEKTPPQGGFLRGVQSKVRNGILLGKQRLRLLGSIGKGRSSSGGHDKETRTAAAATFSTATTSVTESGTFTYSK